VGGVAFHATKDQGIKKMSDPRVENLAKILVDYSTGVKPGDWVLVQGNIIALPLVNEVVRRALQAGGNVNVLLDSEELSETVLSASGDDQLKWVSPIESMLVEKVNCMINLRASGNTRAMNGIAPEKQRLRQSARRKIMETYLQRSAQGDLRWVLTNYPCPAFAQDADMSLRDYEDFVYAATLVDQPDPIKSWQAIDTQQKRLVEWLQGKNQVRLHGPNCDLQLSISGRNFINCSGKNNLPDGEIFTGPVEDSAQGWVRFTYPAVHGGREVDGVELEFEQGKVIKAHAKKNEEYLLTLLDMDAGARYLGEFAIGTNYGIQRFTRDILFDEKIGGSFHMAVGAGYPETGSKNQSSLHWDFICDMRTDSEIWVDDELFYKNGAFQI
jgi:aminopeptidase